MTFCCGGGGTNLSQDALGLVLVSRERRESFFGGVRPQRDERKRLTNCTPKIPGGLGGLAGSLVLLC